jgi:DNA-binding NarL/FixJ family response regulator
MSLTDIDARMDTAQDTTERSNDSAQAAVLENAALPVGLEKPDVLYSVFMVEDSTAIREVLVQSLESSGLVHVVGHADSSAGARDAMVGLHVDAVIVDLNLRAGNGFELLSWLQAGTPHNELIKIVLTNYATPSFRQRCMQLGAHYFFDKSLEFDRVIEVLEAAAKASARGRNH